MQVSVQLHPSAALPPVKSPLVATGSEAGWAPEPVLDNVERRKFLILRNKQFNI
jgi:hypothetical protein